MGQAIEWREVQGFPGYEVNRLGDVRSWRAGGCGYGNRTDSPKQIAISYPKKNQRPYVQLSRDKHSFALPLAKVVAEAFLPPRQASEALAYLNGDLTDCRADNLKWVKV